MLEGLSRRAQAALQARAEELKQDLDAAFGRSEELLTRRIEATLTWAYAATDVPTGGMRTVQTRLLKQLRLLLEEVGAHRELLHADPLAMLEWVDVPDVDVPVTIEEKQLLDERARRAQGTAT